MAIGIGAKIVRNGSCVTLGWLRWSCEILFSEVLRLIA